MKDEHIRKKDAIDLINKISNLDLKAKGGICVSLANLKKADVAPVTTTRRTSPPTTIIAGGDVRRVVVTQKKRIRRFAHFAEQRWIERSESMTLSYGIFMLGFFLIGFRFGGLIGFLYGCNSTRKDFIEIIKTIERDECGEE